MDDTTSPFLRSRKARWAAGFAAWTVLAVLSIAQAGISNLGTNQQVEWSRVIPLRLGDWYTCAVFTPVFFWATRRWPLERESLATRIPLHLLVTLAAVMLKYALFLPIFRATVENTTITYADMLQRSLISELIAFGALAAVVHALEFHSRYRERERLALQLQARLSDAQLRALRMQLNPHFLFNTLNAATTLVHRDPEGADTMLTRLGELLRLTLRADPVHETTLREELEILDRYLDIMRVRFSDRVTITVDIQPSILDALVPSFILQPIVENAFEHGVARLQGPGEIIVRGKRDDSTLVLTVHDNGAESNVERAGDGVGLANTRHRLSELYGSDGSLTFEQRQGQGTTVVLRIPMHTQARAAA